MAVNYDCCILVETASNRVHNQPHQAYRNKTPTPYNLSAITIPRPYLDSNMTPTASPCLPCMQLYWLPLQVGSNQKRRNHPWRQRTELSQKTKHKTLNCTSRTVNTTRLVGTHTKQNKFWKKKKRTTRASGREKSSTYRPKAETERRAWLKKNTNTSTNHPSLLPITSSIIVVAIQKPPGKDHTAVRKT